MTLIAEASNLILYLCLLNSADLGHYIDTLLSSRCQAMNTRFRTISVS